ncbi:hypothetical protein [Acetobacterium bakii]|uniref:Uncharacterized protein n=1 Tax=Acetobacterium bakii TaxID=52689 RepID=A0A0L6U0Y9_9FIRM|nr:hypothetical protein [Acetobacterium bakii]KNZ41465.1 hypothetical protein AKG39_11915 [Acetobacterium bakii]
MKTKSMPGANREAQKKALKRFGIYTEEQLDEAFKIPFDITAFVAPMSMSMSHRKKNDDESI